MRNLRIVASVEKLETAESLDPTIERVQEIVDSVVQPQAVRDVLHGVAAGHPIHPVAVLFPAGAWIGAGVLDAIPGNHKAAELLVAAGIISATPAVLTGYTDWSDLSREQQRVGIVHSAANAAAIGLYAASWVQRKRGHQVSGKVLGYLGLAVLSGSGFLGGHLAYRQGAGVNATADIRRRFPDGWQRLGLLDEFPEGRLLTAEVAGVTLLVYRRGAIVDVIADECSQCSESLADGQVVGPPENPCVECPTNGAIFEFTTGEVVSGPATAPQPRFDAVVSEGMVDVRLAVRPE